MQSSTVVGEGHLDSS